MDDGAEGDLPQVKQSREMSLGRLAEPEMKRLRTPRTPELREPQWLAHEAPAPSVPRAAPVQLAPRRRQLLPQWAEEATGARTPHASHAPRAPRAPERRDLQQVQEHSLEFANQSYRWQNSHGGRSGWGSKVFWLI